MTERAKAFNEYHLYVDESGARNPDHTPKDKNGNPFTRDAFAIGGILVREEDVEECIRLYREFKSRWPEASAPLHSYEIRHFVKNYSWLATDAARAKRFLSDLNGLMTSIPVIGVSCVIDRPGYNLMYREQYNGSRWFLCKTAYSICVERSAKFVINEGYKMRVFVESAGPEENKRIFGYHRHLQNEGVPFDAASCSEYKALGPNDFKNNIHPDIKFQSKNSIMMQIADMYLFPMVMSGYDLTHRPYVALMKCKRIIDSILPESMIPTIGIKYSRFENVKRKGLVA